MAEILLEGRDCEACGTEVRKGALFCYHCGMSVAPDVVVTTDTKEESVSDAWLRGDIKAVAAKEEKTVDKPETVEETGESEIIEDTDDAEIIKETDEAEIVEDETEEREIVENEIVKDEAVIENDKAEIVAEEKEIEDKAQEKSEEKPKLKTAAAMRRKPKQIQKKRVEIVWDEPQSPPNVWFLIATILFAILAVGLWLVAKYLG